MAVMKKLVEQCEKLSSNMPEEPKNILDTEVIARNPNNVEIHLAKRNNQILAVATKNKTITNLIPLDEGALVGIIGWTDRVWERILERLPTFREIINSEAQARGGERQKEDELLEKAFQRAEFEKDLRNSLLPTEEEIEKLRRAEYERGALGQMNWDTSAERLKRAADNLFRIYMEATETARAKGNLRIIVEGGKGWDEHYDEQLMRIYYMLMGLAIENYIKGIIMVNHPEYLTEEGLNKIGKHETYEFFDDSDLKDLLKEFEKYRDILVELAEYVKWKAKYPVTKSYKEFEPDAEFMDRNRIIELYNSLHRRARRERRLEIMRKHQGLTISYQQFMDIKTEIDYFRTPTIKIKDIINAYSQWDEAIILHALADIAEDLEDEPARNELRMQIELYERGRDVSHEKT